MENNSIIYYNNKVLIEFDTLLENDIGLRNDTPTKYLERGAFAQDSKKRNPITLDITGAIGAGFNYSEKVDKAIKILTDLANSDALVDVVTINQTYTNCSLNGFTFKNNSELSGLSAELTFTQVRLVAPQYAQIKNNKPKNKQNTATTQSGNVQPKPLPNSIAIDIGNKINSLFKG